jgi:transcriptional regulator of acetoin/glycerol metabolism
LFRGATAARDIPSGPEREALLNALRLANGNQSEAARHLGVSRVTVWKRIKKHGVDLHRDL